MTSYRERRLAGVHTEGTKAFLADRGLEPAPKEAKEQVKQPAARPRARRNTGAPA